MQQKFANFIHFSETSFGFRLVQNKIDNSPICLLRFIFLGLVTNLDIDATKFHL